MLIWRTVIAKEHNKKVKRTAKEQRVGRFVGGRKLNELTGYDFIGILLNLSPSLNYTTLYVDVHRQKLRLIHILASVSWPGHINNNHSLAQWARVI